MTKWLSTFVGCIGRLYSLGNWDGPWDNRTDAGYKAKAEPGLQQVWLAYLWLEPPSTLGFSTGRLEFRGDTFNSWLSDLLAVPSTGVWNDNGRKNRGIALLSLRVSVVADTRTWGEKGLKIIKKLINSIDLSEIYVYYNYRSRYFYMRRLSEVPG